MTKVSLNKSQKRGYLLVNYIFQHLWNWKKFSVKITFTKHKSLLQGKHIAMALKSRINDMKLYGEISECSTWNMQQIWKPHKNHSLYPHEIKYLLLATFYYSTNCLTSSQKPYKTEREMNATFFSLSLQRDKMHYRFIHPLHRDKMGTCMQVWKHPCLMQPHDPVNGTKLKQQEKLPLYGIRKYFANSTKHSTAWFCRQGWGKLSCQHVIYCLTIAGHLLH